MAGTHALLLIEDNPDDEALSLTAISRSGIPCEVVTLRHGQHALTHILSPDQPLPDLIVLDFQLPGANGLEILRAVRADERTCHVPVVMLTGKASQAELAHCLASGANSCVVKGVDPEAYTEHVALIVRYWFTVDARSRPNL